MMNCFSGNTRVSQGHGTEQPPQTSSIPGVIAALRRFVFGVATALVISAACLSVQAATLPTGFTETLVAGGLSSPTAMAFAPDGRLFVCLQGGQLRVIKNGVLLPTPFMTLSPDASGERGLLGITFDPGFPENNFLYVYYTVTSTPRHNRVSRFTADGDVVVAGSETPILDLEGLNASNHNGGAIHFGPDGKLYVAVGENAVASNSQTLNNRLGKLLRINADGSIPSDNPFFNVASGDNRAIWVLGLRNPFTFAFQPGTTRMFINDVGQSTWEEINDGIAASNYGWPTTEGPTTNPSFRGPLFAYGRSPSSTGGCAITGGTFYNPPTNQFPASYTGKYFFADFCSGWIRLLDPLTNTASAFATGISFPVDLQVGSDGSLYYLARGSGAVFRVQYAPEPPTITTHPADRTVTEGQTANFQVSATGSAPLSYQWQRNMVDIPGANAASYTTPATVLADSGAKFRCVVTNSFGTATSNEATLTVTEAPSIATHPSNQTVTEGQTATFTVSANGSSPLGYQWQRNMVNITGANAASYTTPATVLADNGAKFRCVVTNAFGTANSNEATLTVTAPPSIATHPSDQTVTAGQTATFNVSANGSVPLSYQWQRNMVNITGANAASYTTPATVLGDNGAKFRCVVTNAFGTANSNEATLTVNAPPSIATHPSDQTVTAGQTATFNVSADGSSPLSYQWQRNMVNIPGANAASYTTPATVLADNGAKFRCVVTNAFGTANSNEATLTVTEPPSIATHPSNQTVTEGQTATFTVSANGSSPLSYQWQRNMVNIPGANAASYTTPATALADNGAKFRCVVTNTFGTANSNEATLTVTAPPSIATHPLDQTVTAGQTATFTVSANGSVPLSYQWQRNMVNITGANAASYTTPATVLGDNGAKFRCVVTNAFGTATSNEATLTVTEAPSIATHPSNQTVTEGQTATFTVSANGSVPLSYQWQRNMVNITGANAASYTTPATVLGDNGAKFRCVVTNAFGTANSNEATLTVNAPPSIATHPSDQTVTAGQTATFNVSADGSSPLSYQWQRNMVNIPGANAASYTTPATVLGDNGAKFRCVVTNAFGTANSNEATLTVTEPPSIATHPLNQNVTEGQTATFSVSANGSVPLSYQWQRNMVNIPGANAASYTTPATVLGDNGAKFRCVVTNTFGAANSNEATLTVEPPPPSIVTEENTDIAVALDSVHMLRDPFRLTTVFNFSSDQRTRIVFFALNADLLPGENSSAVTCLIEDPLLMSHPATVEFVGKVPDFASLTEIVIRLPDSLTGTGDFFITITVHGRTSNRARIRIR